MAQVTFNNPSINPTISPAGASVRPGTLSPNIPISDPSDAIAGLPTDQSVPSEGEIQIVDTLFKEKHGTIQKIMGKSKEVLIAGLLYALFSLKYIDQLFIRVVPSLQNTPYILLLVKTVVFMLVFFIVKNWYLSRKN